jgi:TonB family protein
MSKQLNRAEARFGLLPEPERNTGSMVTSAAINGLIVLVVFYVGAMAHHAMVVHRFEQTQLIVPVSEPPKPKVKIEPPKDMPPPPELPKIQLNVERKIEAPVPPRPEPKPIQMEAKLETPAIKVAKPNVILAPQPKAALTAAMPAQNASVKASTAPVHLGQTFGATPNPNANRPATIAAIGNPYGGMRGPAVAPHGVVGSAGIGNGLRAGSNSGVVGKVASAGIPGASQGTAGPVGHVGSAGIPAVQQAQVVRQTVQQPTTTSIEIISKAPPQYTAEARQLKVQGDVVLRVTFLASGRVQVLGVVRGLGHGLDEEARRAAEQIRFRPATRNGQPVDTTTNITIGFQMA